MQSLRERGKNPVWTALVLLAVSLVLGCIPMFFACVVDRTTLFISYFQNPLIAVLNILPVVLLAFLLYLASNRAWFAAMMSGFLCLLMGFVNYYKIAFRNEPLNFEDITVIREAGNMTGRGYTLFLNRSMVAALLLVALAVVFLKLFADGKMPAQVRLVGASVIFVGALFLREVYLDNTIYLEKTKNIEHINQWAESQVYYSKGLVYPFLHSAGAFSFPVPEDYDELRIRGWLEGYEEAPIPEERRVDVMSIMLEAYADFDKFELEGLNPSVYAPLRRIREESVYGSLVTNIFAGGTTNTERAFLSGLLYMPTFRSRTNAYPWYFRQSGYHTEGAHASYDWFYNRNNINPNMGFEEYFFIGDELVGNSTYDRDFLPKLEERYRAYCEENEAPYFAYHLTYQGHGPYSAQGSEWGMEYMQRDDLSADSLNILNSYFGGVQNTMETLTAMLENLQDFERPLVVVVFGDHMPWLGDAAGIYHELGINLAPDTPEGYLNYYSTPYFIWANDKAREVLGQEFSGYGGLLAPCLLMNQLFALCGWDGPAYMQCVNEVMEEIPGITDQGVYFLADGTVTIEAPEIARRFDALQYYRQKQFSYSHVLEGSGS